MTLIRGLPEIALIRLFKGRGSGLISDSLYSQSYTQLTKKATCEKLDNAFDIPPENIQDPL